MAMEVKELLGEKIQDGVDISWQYLCYFKNNLYVLNSKFPFPKEE